MQGGAVFLVAINDENLDLRTSCFNYVLEFF